MPNTQNKQPLFIWIGIVAAILFWLLETLLDAYVFNPEPFLLELFPLHEPAELWMRFVVVFLLISFGIYANSVTRRNEENTKYIKSKIQETQALERELVKNDQCLHEFYSIASSINQSFESRLERLLKLGCQRFGMEIGILSNINGNEYRVVGAITSGGELESGTVFALEKTFCEITIKTDKPVNYTYMAKSEMQTHPAYLDFKLEAYIGTRILVDGKLYGTLNFTSPNPHEKEFTQAERDFLQLMGEWISSELLHQKSETKHQQAISVFNNTNDGILITDANRKIIAVNKAFTTITGYTEEEAIGKNPRFLKSGHHGVDFYNNLWESVKTTGQWQGDIWNRRKDGEIIPIWQNISTVKDEKGNVLNYTSVFSDISSIKEYEEKLKHAAHHDALTGLANRVLFGIHLNHSLQKAKRNETGFALLFLDLDGFKKVNDTMGHGAGDQLLQCIAQRLKECIREEDTAARFGGDEFTVILEDVSKATDAESISAKIINQIAEPVIFGDQSISVSTSIGICMYPDDGEDSEELLHAADFAMFRAKSHGKNNYRLFSRITDDQITSETK